VGIKKAWILTYRPSKEYNNEMAGQTGPETIPLPTKAFYFEYVFGATGSQTTTMTVLGESATTPVASPDQVINVGVPVSLMNSAMVVGGQTGLGFGYPEVTLSWTMITELNTMYDTYVAVDAVAPTTFRDYLNQEDKATLQKVFAQAAFTFDPDNLLGKIPIEAVKSIDYSGALGVKNEDGVNATVLVSGSQGEAQGILPYSIIAETDVALADDKKRAVRSLFLQALAADRYLQASAGATAGDATSQSASTGFRFQEGDEVSIFTRLQLVKTRKFQPDTESQVVSSGGLKFSVDGCDVVIGDGTEADDSYASEPKYWVVEWRMNLTA
jgi:hypothetical protein